jgi:hypothetical protein
MDSIAVGALNKQKAAIRLGDKLRVCSLIMLCALFADLFIPGCPQSTNVTRRRPPPILKRETHVHAEPPPHMSCESRISRLEVHVGMEW